MIYYVFYKPNAFDSVTSLRFNCGSPHRAEALAAAELRELPGQPRILYTLPGAAVCPECRHPWDQHEAHGCKFQVVLACEDGLHESRCICRRRLRPTTPVVAGGNQSPTSKTSVADRVGGG